MGGQALRRTPHHGFPIVSLGAEDLRGGSSAPHVTQGMPPTRQGGHVDGAGSDEGIRAEAGSAARCAASHDSDTSREEVAKCSRLGGDGNEAADAPDARPRAAAGRFEGIILRSTLRVLLAARFNSQAPVRKQACRANAEHAEAEAEPRHARCLWDRIACARPHEVSLSGDIEIYEQLSKRRYTGESKRHARTWEWASFANEDLEQYINLGAYMNASAHRVGETCLLHKAYSLFQHMNLRHLPVVNHENVPVGMISRENLTKALLHKTTRTYLRDSDLHLPRRRCRDDCDRPDGYGATQRMLRLLDRLAIPLATRPSSHHPAPADPAASQDRGPLSSTLMPLATETPSYFTGGPLGTTFFAWC